MVRGDDAAPAPPGPNALAAAALHDHLLSRGTIHQKAQQETPMFRHALAAFILGVWFVTPAKAGPGEEARRIYAAFVAAQNAHDFAGLRDTLLDQPEFLWVTNGLSVWGPEMALRRIMGFHASEVWHITPLEARSVAIEVNPSTAFLHVPLELVVGPRDAPARYRILVSALCTETPKGWRIAALFTTDSNPEQWPE
jgi:hypothetical protein